MCVRHVTQYTTILNTLGTTSYDNILHFIYIVPLDLVLIFCFSGLVALGWDSVIPPELISVAFRISVVENIVPLRWNGGCENFILPGLKPWPTDIKLLRSFFFFIKG